MSKSTQADPEMDAQAEFEALRQRAAVLGVIPQQIAMARDGRVRLAVLDYARFSGDQPPAGYISLGLCVRSVAAISRHSQHGPLSGVLRPGSVIVSPPDDGAFVRWDRCRMVAIGIDPAGLDNRLSLGDSSRFVSSAATRIHRDPLLTAIMTTLWHESQLHGLSGDFFDHCIRQIFTRLGELVNVQPTRRRDRPLTDRQIKMVKEFVETHLVDGPERLAAMVDLSPDHFGRAFRASLGTSPLRYVSDRRVRRAKAMLLDPSVPITAIAMALGYATPSHFTESFHKATGTTPSQWRRNRR